MPEQWDQNMFFSNGAWQWSDSISYFDLLCSTHEWIKHLNVHTKVLLMREEKDPCSVPPPPPQSLSIHALFIIPSVSGSCRASVCPEELTDQDLCHQRQALKPSQE